ncbi:hypothetical protein Vadar_021073 [Vaccinium darrowii]|uniref:Uncharacterized protein n=1 Tax=Vaccinium darrowii TaxID=229202 RepID=A0ACB7X363_9ERIC|nr:hypothetical protein Vadar_021073 [Vaccinium darrowii]
MEFHSSLFSCRKQSRNSVGRTKPSYKAIHIQKCPLQFFFATYKNESEMEFDSSLFSSRKQSRNSAGRTKPSYEAIHIPKMSSPILLCRSHGKRDACAHDTQTGQDEEKKSLEHTQHAGKISGEEGFISLGPWGKGGGEYWAYKADGPIMQITIRYGGVIDSIVIESKSSSGVLIGSPSEFGGRGGPNKLTFCIDTSVEQLSSISLTYGDYVGDSKPAIGSLYFKTDQNTYGVAGNRASNFSYVSIPIKGGVIAGFHGYAESYISAFGIFVAPKVDHKGKNSGEDGSISLGPWGGEDGVDWVYKLDRPITQISIDYETAIESIVFESKSYDGGVIEGSEKIGGDGGYKKETFCIDSSKEQVSSIFLTFGEGEREGGDGLWHEIHEAAIHTLGINTNLRTYGPFGWLAGDSSVSIPIEGGVLTGFHGRLGRYINAIGVFVAPKINNTLPSSGKKVDGLHSIQDSDASTSKLKGKISDKEAEQKKEISGKEGCISLGPWGGEDGTDWVYKPDGRLLQICILYGEAINSIVFASKSYDGVVIGRCKKIGSNGDGSGIETV